MNPLAKQIDFSNFLFWLGKLSVIGCGTIENVNATDTQGPDFASRNISNNFCNNDYCKELIAQFFQKSQYIFPT